MLNIVYCCNDKIFDGLYLSILSILKRTKHSINFYILTGDLTVINTNYQPLSNKHISILKQMIKSFNKQNTLTVYDAGKRYLSNFGKVDIAKVTPYNMFKLFIPEFKYHGNELLYIDTDTMANGDVAIAFDVDMTKAELCVCHVYNIQLVFGKDTTYFNGGVFLMNLDLIRKNHYFEKALDYYLKNKPLTLEEAALNKTWSAIKFWPNEFRFNYQKPGIEKDTIIKHFVNPLTSGQFIKIKQWDIAGVQNWLNLHNWDEDYKYFLEQKKHWK